MNKRLLMLSVSVLCAFQMVAQERLVDIYGNPVLEKNGKELIEQKSVRSNDTLELPFFDDFSVISVYPDQSKWLGFDVFINDMWGVNPISYGVASFDVADSVGVIRSLASSGEMSDVLTSRPINLEYDVEDSVYLSFAVQRGGSAQIPEYQDSLVLQFNSPDTIWHSVWNMEGGELDTAFQQFLVPVLNENLLVKGFEFRFISYGSVASNSPVPSYNSNNDIWNLDYVLLDTARTMNDTIINDIAMMYNVSSLITGFESVPWKHYLANQAAVPTDSIVFKYRSNGELEQYVNRQFIISDVWGNGSGFSSVDDNENIHAYEKIIYTKPVPYVYESDQADSACFEVKAFIKTDEEPEGLPYRWNDTVYYTQKFSNYYAYDDGIPEKGYGIGGVGTSTASLACRFEPIANDTLRGVYIYFNKVLNDENDKCFYLMAWDDDEGLPGDTLVNQIGVCPVFKDTLFDYTYYALDTPVYISDAFHIGWTKTTDEMMNVGFDLSRDASENVHINVFGTWQMSSFPGSVMIRPVFSENPILSVSATELEVKNEINLYPNPANDIVYIDSFEDIDLIRLVNAYGQVVREYNYEREISVADLQSGMYIVMLYKDGGLLGTEKLLVRP